MNGNRQSGQPFGKILEKAGIKPSDFAHSETTPGRQTPTGKGRKKKRTGKSRAKMWHITGLLQQNPEVSDADIKRSIRTKFTKKDGSPEAVSDDIIQEARWIFARRLEQGDIVVKGRPAYLNNVQQGYMALSDQDRKVFLAWLRRGAPEEDVRRPTESERDFRERRRKHT